MLLLATSCRKIVIQISVKFTRINNISRYESNYLIIPVCIFGKVEDTISRHSTSVFLLGNIASVIYRQIFKICQNRNSVISIPSVFPRLKSRICYSCNIDCSFFASTKNLATPLNVIV